MTPAAMAIYGLGMAREHAPAPGLGAVPVLWYTVAFNLSALLVSLTALGFNDEGVWPLWLPVASLALCAATGVICLFGAQTRSYGVGCLGGTALSIFVFVALFMIFFVTYFLVPGGHELS